MDTLRTWLTELYRALQFPLLSVGPTRITVWSLLYLVLVLALLVWGSRVLRRVVIAALRRGNRVDPGVAHSIGSISRYVVVLVGLLIAVQTAGIDLTTLNVLAGAVGLGVGFGLQTIAANFISGVILLIGRPIKAGDRVEVGGVEGDVVEIGARATTVRTNDNILIIVPNEKLVTESVVNWSHTDRSVRFKIPVQVAYGSDVRKVEQLLIEVARGDPDVLDQPPPSVRFVEFGDNGIKLELRVWSTSLIHRKGVLISNVNFGIYDALRANDVEIPFPQRVVHLRDRP